MGGSVGDGGDEDKFGMRSSELGMSKPMAKGICFCSCGKHRQHFD